MFLSDISLEESPLHTYARDGDLEGVKVFLKGKKVWSSVVIHQKKKKNGLNKNENTNEQTALHVAIEFEKTEVALFLIQFGANIELKDKIGRTPLLYAARLDCSFVTSKIW